MFALLASLILATPPIVLARLSGEDMARLRITAELLAVPVGLSASGLADSLLAQSGLTPWNGEEQRFRMRGTSIEVRGLYAANGRSLIFYYTTGGAHSGRLCRIETERAPVGAEQYRAVRWCAEMLGVGLPRTLPSPIVTFPRTGDG